MIFSQHQITNDLSDRILYNVITRVSDIAKTSFAFPYIMVLKKIKINKIKSSL